jgi:hypothetical protein
LLFHKDEIVARDRRLTSVILATQEAEIRRIVVRSQPEQIPYKTLSRKYPSQKRAHGVAQGEGPEFKPQYRKKKKKKKHEIVIPYFLNVHEDEPRDTEPLLHIGISAYCLKIY